MLLVHSPPIPQRSLRLLLPLREVLQIRIRIPRLELDLTSAVELLHCSIVCVANAFDAGLAVVVAAAERSDGALSAALDDDWTAGLAEVLDVLRVEAAFEVFYSGDSGE